MSCREISKDELESTIPVNPPTVNKKIKPKDHSIGESRLIEAPLIVEIQLNTLTPVGTAITIVAAVK